jgi:6-phospho-3-hexuloisomerase
MARGKGAGERVQEAQEHILREVRRMAQAPDPKVTEDLVQRLNAAKKVIVFGRGRSGLVARMFAVRLHHLGIASYVVGETTTPPVDRETMVVLFSGSGETFAVSLTAQLARGMGASIAVITSVPDSTVAQNADLTILLPAPAQPRKDLAPLGTLFESAASLYVDGIVAELMARRGETEESMRRRHATLE